MADVTQRRSASEFEILKTFVGRPHYLKPGDRHPCRAKCGVKAAHGVLAVAVVTRGLRPPLLFPAGTPPARLLKGVSSSP